MREEEEVREGCPEVGAIDVGLSGTLGVINVLQGKTRNASFSEKLLHTRHKAVKYLLLSYVLEQQPPRKRRDREPYRIESVVVHGCYKYYEAVLREC